MPEALPQLADLIAAGKFGVPVWRAYPLDRAAKPHADIEVRRNQGKVVLWQPPTGVRREYSLRSVESAPQIRSSLLFAFKEIA
ncbi:zinc-binding dehydrogenase [Streptomyces sp. NPDC001982]|uniref:zinc-binding dehydrogenase n=1 Tax=Streptomyces sp. NPDC001982 TaxID=3154405 RepID=UPI00332B77FA